MVAQGYGSLGLMTSELVCPDGRTRRSCFYRALEGDAWLVKRPSPKSVGYSPEAVFGAFLLGFLLSKAKAPRLPTWLFGAARN